MEISESCNDGLEDIAEKHEIVLIDTCCLHGVENSLTYELYDWKSPSEFNISSLEENISFLSNNLNILNTNSNIYAPGKIIEEMKSYIDILDNALRYHKRNINSNKSTSFSKSRKKRNYKKKSKYKNYNEANEDDFEDSFEDIALGLLKSHSDQVFDVINILKNRESKLNDEGLFKTIKQISSRQGLKISYNSKHNEFIKKEKEDKFSDEYLVANAYELASNNEDIAIVSDDSDIKRILSHCFYRERSLFNVPKKGRLALYSKFNDEKYGLKFDTTFFLHNLN